MADFTTTDYFGDESVAADTYPYYDFLLTGGRRVWREPYHGVVMVAGHEEVLAVMRDTASFSNCNIVAGPNFTFPVELTGDDVTDAVAAHRDELPMGDQIIAFDPPKHTAHRALLMGLITPKRLKENEEFMGRLADRQLDRVLPAGGPAPVRVPARAAHRPAQRPPAHLVRGGHPHLPRSTAGAGRGTRRHRAPVRPDGRDQGVRVRPRAGRRPALRVPADLHDPRAAPAQPRIRLSGTTALT